jgi:YbbR domain-containing protein
MDIIRYWLGILYDYAKDYVLENTGLKILALLITAVLWLSVASRPVTEVVLHGVLIELGSVPPGLIPTKFDTLSASVTLRGPRDVLDTLRPGDVTLRADLAGVEPGVRVITVRLDRTRLPANVDEVSIDPYSVRVTIEREATKEVMVKPRFDGDPARGYQLIDWHVEPPNIQVVGAASQVRDITEVSTETISLSGKNAPFSEYVAIDIGSTSISIEGDNNRQVKLSVIIGEARKERVIEKVPVTVTGSAGARANPAFVSVKVSGPSSKVDLLTASDLSVSAEYRKSASGEIVVKPSVKLVNDADDIKIVSVSPDSIELKGKRGRE